MIADLLAPDTMHYLDLWIVAAEISDGALFRRVRRGGVVGDRLETGTIARIFRDMAERAGVDPAGVSALSLRVGCTQDQLDSGVELPAVTQTGGWKSPAMPARYG